MGEGLPRTQKSLNCASSSHMGPCASSPVPRISRSPLRENEAPEREAERRTFLFRGEKIFNELEPQSLKACPV